MNVVMIIVALWIAPHSDNPGVALAMGVFVSGLLANGIPGAGGDAPRPVPLAAMASGRRRRAAHRPADVAGRIRFVGGAGQPAARHADRHLPDHRQRVVAVLRGPPHGIPARGVQHRAGHRDPSGPFAASRGRIAGAFHRHARLGAEARDPAGFTGRGRHAGVRRSVDRHHVRLRGVPAARRADGELRAHGLLMGPARVQPRQGAGARIFRAPGHAHAGARRTHRARLQHGDQRRRGVAGPLSRISRIRTS